MCAREKKAKRSSYPSYRVFFYCFRPKSCKYGTGPTQERKKTGSAVNVSPVLSMTIMFTSTTMSYMTTMTNMITMTTMTGCTQGSWRLSDQMRIAMSIVLNDESWLTQSVSQSVRFIGVGLLGQLKRLITRFPMSGLLIETKSHPIRKGIERSQPL